MLTLICGLPNAGKTTCSENFDNVLHLDDFKRAADVRKEVSMMDEVTVEGIYPTKSIRRNLVKAYDGKTRCVFLDMPVSVCVERENRGRNELIIRNCSELFEAPSYDEGWDEIIVLRDTRELEQWLKS